VTITPHPWVPPKPGAKRPKKKNKKNNPKRKNKKPPPLPKRTPQKNKKTEPPHPKTPPPPKKTQERQNKEKPKKEEKKKKKKKNPNPKKKKHKHTKIGTKKKKKKNTKKPPPANSSSPPLPHPSRRHHAAHCAQSGCPPPVRGAEPLPRTYPKTDSSAPEIVEDGPGSPVGPGVGRPGRPTSESGACELLPDRGLPRIQWRAPPRPTRVNTALRMRCHTPGAHRHRGRGGHQAGTHCLRIGQPM